MDAHLNFTLKQAKFTLQFISHKTFTVVKVAIGSTTL